MLPPTSHAIPRRSALIAAASITALLTGCSPTPTPTPTPTAAFASEQEAFAAAEKTFEEYTDALNQVDTTKPETFDAVFALSSGKVEKADRKNFSTMHAEGQIISGNSRVLLFEGLDSRAQLQEVTASVCLDVSDVTITYPDGSSAVNPNRPAVYALEVTFRASQSGKRLLVDSANTTDQLRCPAY